MEWEPQDSGFFIVYDVLASLHGPGSLCYVNAGVGIRGQCKEVFLYQPQKPWRTGGMGWWVVNSFLLGRKSRRESQGGTGKEKEGRETGSGKGRGSGARAETGPFLHMG